MSRRRIVEEATEAVLAQLEDLTPSEQVKVLTDCLATVREWHPALRSLARRRPTARGFSLPKRKTR